MRKVLFIFRLVAAVLIFFAGACFGPDFAYAAAPQAIGYEGYATDSTDTPQTGSQTVRVRLYDAATAGTLLFDETHGSVTFSNGYFFLAIGSGTYNGGSVSSLADLAFDQGYFLTIEITSLATGEMSPRTPMNAVPHAYTAGGIIAQAANPSTNINAGELYFNTASSTIRMYDGVTWLSLARDADKENVITASTTATYYRGDKTFQMMDTSMVPENGNLYFTDARTRAAFSSSVAGLTYATGTGVFSLTAGYVIPPTASTTQWDAAYANRIISAVGPLVLTGNALSLTQASSTSDGYLSSIDWSAFNSRLTTSSASGLTLVGDVGGTIGATVIANNVIDGTKLALGSDANGDLMYYDGTDWVRLAAGTSGQVLQTNGLAAPSWATTTGISAGTATNNTVRWSGTAWVESSALTNNGTSVTSTGNLAVGGGTISTPATTAYLFNTNATTLRIGGSATTISLGADGAIATGGGAFTLRSGDATALTLDSGTTGLVNLGTGSNVKTITIGNTTGATVLNIQSGTGNINLQVAGTGATGNVQVGAGGAGSATPDLLVLDRKSTSGDPTGTNGAVYYNSSANKFRCYENSAWINCITPSGSDVQHASSYDTDETLTNVPTGGAQVTLGTISLTPTTDVGDIYVAGWADVYSSNATDQPLQLVIETTNNCTGSTVGNASVTYTINSNASTANDRGSIRVSGIAVDPGASAQAYSLCAAVTSGGGDTDILNWGIEAMVIDTGADLAEIYTTLDGSLEAGDVVSLDPRLKTGVKKSAHAHDQTVIGIISTRPGMVTGGVDKEGVQALPVALSGRVPVKVVTENGPIEPGDYLVPSSVPGVAMKATGAGSVIGQAMSAYADQGVGTVLAFVKNFNSGGEVVSISERIANGAQIMADFVASRVEAVRGYFDELFTKTIHAEQLCMKRSDGTEVCMDGDSWPQAAESAPPPIIPMLDETPAPVSDPVQVPDPVPVSESVPDAPQPSLSDPAPVPEPAPTPESTMESELIPAPVAPAS